MANLKLRSPQRKLGPSPRAAARETFSSECLAPGSRLSPGRTAERQHPLIPTFFIAIAALAFAPPAHTQNLLPYTIAGDAIPQSLTGKPGDAANGRKIVATRQIGLCLLCHSGPFQEERFQGDLSPSLAGAGSRSSEGQLRLRIVDASKLNPDTIMPAYYRVDGLNNVAQQFRGKPVLTAEQIEDVVAFLMTLRD